MQEGYPVLVCEENHKVMGFATFGPFREWPAYKYTIEHSIYVHDKYRNKGIGTAVVKELIRISNEREFATIVAGIDEANEKSIKIHEKLGFKHTGTIHKAGFKFRKWLNLAFYQFCNKLGIDGVTVSIHRCLRHLYTINSKKKIGYYQRIGPILMVKQEWHLSLKI